MKVMGNTGPGIAFWSCLPLGEGLGLYTPHRPLTGTKLSSEGVCSWAPWLSSAKATSLKKLTPEGSGPAASSEGD